MQQLGESSACRVDWHFQIQSSRRIRIIESITVITLLLSALDRIDLQAVFDRDGAADAYCSCPCILARCSARTSFMSGWPRKPSRARDCSRNKLSGRRPGWLNSNRAGRRKQGSSRFACIIGQASWGRPRHRPEPQATRRAG
jgi:hypothetical protein